VIKAEFSASLLQSSVSHDPSEIILIWWFDAQETFMIIINDVKKMKNVKHFVFQDSLMNRKFRRTVFIWNENLYLLSFWINLMHLWSNYRFL